MPWRPFVDRATYRGWGWFVVGAALLMPYMMAGAVVQQLWGAGSGYGNPLLFAQLPVFIAVLPVVALTALALPVRAPSVLLARTLLETPIPDVTAARDWPRRGRDAAWFTLHLAVGALLSGVTLAVVPFAVFIALLPWIEGTDVAERYLAMDGWQPWWGPPLAVVLLLVLIYLIAAATRLMRWCAPRLLGPTALEQVTIARARARDLAVRNRLARELHDSVGHALSVVTIQSAAATSKLQKDPDFVRQALRSVEETARRALSDLDTVLGLLRTDEATESTSVRTLEALPRLLSSCGLRVEAESPADFADVPAVISREAYRLVQEALTNALKHGADATARVRLEINADRLLIEVSNPIRFDAAPARAGRGLQGMSERVTILGGHIDWGARDGRWQVTARLPVGSAL